jgi:hypothetical protein
MGESCLWLLDVGLVVNPFSVCTQPSILEPERRWEKMCTSSVVVGGKEVSRNALKQSFDSLHKQWREISLSIS